MFVRVQAVAVGKTSSEHAYTLGRPDAVGAISRTEEMTRAEQICQAVNIPVSVDAEDGWGVLGTWSRVEVPRPTKGHRRWIPSSNQCRHGEASSEP